MFQSGTHGQTDIKRWSKRDLKLHTCSLPQNFYKLLPQSWSELPLQFCLQLFYRLCHIYNLSLINHSRHTLFPVMNRHMRRPMMTPQHLIARLLRMLTLWQNHGPNSLKFVKSERKKNWQAKCKWSIRPVLIMRESHRLKKLTSFSGIGAMKIISNLFAPKSPGMRVKTFFLYTQTFSWSMIDTAMSGMLVNTLGSQTTTMAVWSWSLLMLLLIIMGLWNKQNMRHSSKNKFIKLTQHHLWNSSRNLFLSYSLDSHSKLDLTQDTFDILGYLVFHYGFVPPLPLQSKSAVDPKDWETNIKNISLNTHKNPLPADLAEPIVSFLKGLQLAASPSQELWDLCLGNQRKVDILCLTQIISKKHDDLFFLGPPSLLEKPHCPWTVVLTTAANALFVYHLLLEKDSPAISLGHLLVDEGISFCTLQPLPNLPVPFSTRTVHAVVPICIRDY